MKKSELRHIIRGIIQEIGQNPFDKASAFSKQFGDRPWKAKDPTRKRDYNLTDKDTEVPPEMQDADSESKGDGVYDPHAGKVFYLNQEQSDAVSVVRNYIINVHNDEELLEEFDKMITNIFGHQEKL